MRNEIENRVDSLLCFNFFDYEFIKIVVKKLIKI